MSVKIWKEVWNLDLTPAQQLVLLALADHANEKGEKVFPSIGRIAWKTNYSPRQVQRIVKELIQRQLLVLVEDNSKKGTSNRYRIDLEAGNYKRPYKVGRKKGEGRQNVVKQGATTCHTKNDGSVVPRPDIGIAPGM